MYCYNVAGGALKTEGESHRNTKTLACINRRENTSKSIASLRMRKKFSGFPIHQLSWNLVNVRQILANEDTPTTLTFLYETERQPEQTEHIPSPAKNVEIKQILKFRKKHLCGIITILTLAWMCDVDRQSHESPAVTKLRESSIVSVQLLSLFSEHIPAIHLIGSVYTFLPCACSITCTQAHPSTILLLQGPHLCPTSSRDPFLFPTRRGVIYPKDELQE